MLRLSQEVENGVPLAVSSSAPLWFSMCAHVCRLCERDHLTGW